jgi:hypothetical protein
MVREIFGLTLCETLQPMPHMSRQSRNRMMNMKCFLALPLVLSLAISAAAQARTSGSRAQPQGYAYGGREVAAPPWSDACMTDHGPSQCDEPMWVYGSSRALARYKSAFCAD